MYKPDAGPNLHAQNTRFDLVSKFLVHSMQCPIRVVLHESVASAVSCGINFLFRSVPQNLALHVVQGYLHHCAKSTAAGQDAETGGQQSSCSGPVKASDYACLLFVDTHFLTTYFIALLCTY